MILPIKVCKISCYKLQDIKEDLGKDYYNFNLWLKGQTIMLHPETSEELVYAWDYERFKEEILPIESSWREER